MARQKVWAGAAVAAAMAVGAIGGAVIGVPSLSGAQSNSTTTTVPGYHPFGPRAGMPGMPGPKQDVLAAAAKALNLTTDQLLQKLSDGKTTIADVAKQQNVDINTVIDAMVGADRDRITHMVNNPLPRFKGGPDGDGGAHMGPGKFGRRGGAGLDAVAKAVGISTQELMQDLRNGQTIKQIAQSKNIDVNTLIDTLVKDASAKIDQAVRNHKLTTAQGNAAKAELRTHITDLVNNGFPRFGGPMMGGHRFGGPMMGGAPTA